MSRREHSFLLSEQAALKDMLDRTAPESAIRQHTLTQRLAEVEAELLDYPAVLPAQPTEALLSFEGKPVAGRQGIDAGFGGDAVRTFENAVAAVGASQHSAADLGALDRIPNREDYRLMITDVVRGSFGFQLEGASSQTAFESMLSHVEAAIARTQDILKASVESDDAMAHIWDETDERAVNAIRKFVDVLHSKEATCRLRFKGGVFAFRDVSQVQASVKRLSQKPIPEEHITLVGYFQGYLPKRQLAEFVVDEPAGQSPDGGKGEVIQAKVERTVAEEKPINALLKQRVRISVRIQRVKLSAPRYFVTKLEVPVKEDMQGLNMSMLM